MKITNDVFFRLLRKTNLLNSIADYTIKRERELAQCAYYNLSHKNAMIENDVLLINKPSFENNQNNKEKIIVKRGSVLNGCQLLVFKHGGKILIGESSFVGEGSRIWSGAEITIGKRVLISHNVNIHDNNSHSLNAKVRHEEFVKIWTEGLPEVANYNDKPIIIEDDVWIGFNSTIAKGVRIGKGSIIGSNSYIKEDVQPNTVIAGNPAKIISKIQ